MKEFLFFIVGCLVVTSVMNCIQIRKLNNIIEGKKDTKNNEK